MHYGSGRQEKYLTPGFMSHVNINDVSDHVPTTTVLDISLYVYLRMKVIGIHIALQIRVGGQTGKSNEVSTLS